MEEKIKEIMSQVFEMKVGDFPDSISQEKIGNWDSLRHLNLIVELEEAFDKSFEPEEISEMISMEKIIETISKK